MSFAGKTIAALERVGLLALFERAAGSGGIVAYHDITPTPFLPAMHITADALQAQLEFLGQHYRVVALEEYVRRRREGRPLRGCVALTFDDAYRGVLDRALPILRRLGLPATVFVVSGYSAAGTRYWWDRLAWVTLAAAPAERIRLAQTITGASGPAPRDVLGAVLRHGAGRLTPQGEAMLCAAEEEHGFVPERPLRPSELRQLARCDLIDFGCHTESHPALPYFPPQEQEREIATSYRWLAERFPRVRPFLAYPFGLYTGDTVRAAQRAGMQAAFSLSGRPAAFRFGLHTCPRIAMAEGNTVLSLRAHLNWWTIPIIAWRNRRWLPPVPPRNLVERVRSPGSVAPTA